MTSSSLRYKNSDFTFILAGVFILLHPVHRTKTMTSHRRVSQIASFGWLWSVDWRLEQTLLHNRCHTVEQNLVLPILLFSISMNHLFRFSFSKSICFPQRFFIFLFPPVCSAPPATEVRGSSVIIVQQLRLSLDTGEAKHHALNVQIYDWIRCLSQDLRFAVLYQKNFLLLIQTPVVHLPCALVWDFLMERTCCLSLQELFNSYSNILFVTLLCGFDSRSLVFESSTKFVSLLISITFSGFVSMNRNPMCSMEYPTNVNLLDTGLSVFLCCFGIWTKAWHPKTWIHFRFSSHPYLMRPPLNWLRW